MFSVVATGTTRQPEVSFEADLRAAGVRPITSRPFHPQTRGKIERFHQTPKRWLGRQRLAADIAELQAVLDVFVAYYNEQRPHRGIGRSTPLERWKATPPAVSLGVALPARQAGHRRSRRRRAPAGTARGHPRRCHAGRTAWVMFDDTPHRCVHR